MGNIFSGDSEIHETTIRSGGGASSTSSSNLPGTRSEDVTTGDGTTIDIDDDDPDTSGSGSVMSSTRDNVEMESTVGDDTNKINREDGEDKTKKDESGEEYNSDKMLQDFVNLLFASLWVLGTFAAIRSGLRCGIGKGKLFNFLKALLFGPFYFVWLKVKCRIQVTQGV